VLGVVILDLVDKDYSWVVLTQSDRPPGYTAADMDQSLATEEDATAALHDAMRLARGNRLPAPGTNAAPQAAAACEGA
jgi:hypothetical protein